MGQCLSLHCFDIILIYNMHTDAEVQSRIIAYNEINQQHLFDSDL